MPVEILLPTLAADADEVTLASWLVKEGDSVKSGDVLVEVETDKAMLEVESEHEGTVGKILVPAGEAASVGQCIALLLQDGESLDDLESVSAAPAAQEEAPQAVAAPAASGPAPIELLLPAFSPDATEAKLDSWLVSEGDVISAGDVIVEVETDKAVLEVEAEQSGTLGKIIVPAGSEAQVGGCIALILPEGMGPEALENYVPGGAPAEAPQAVAAAPSAPAPAAAPAATTAGGRVLASPLARRIAKGANVDLSQLSGSGPNGRVVKKDVEAAIKSGVSTAPAVAAAPEAKPAAAAAPAPAIDGAYDELPNSGMRKVIAKRLGESKREIPHFYLSVDIELDELLAMRKDLNKRAEEKGRDYKLSVNDFVVKAVALALRDVPDANASWTEEAVLRYHDVDISVAVATDSGLITPIVRKADQKGLSTISADVKGLAKKAREGRLVPQEYQGGGFTISNLGMYGIKQFSAIVNPPQSCILAVGAGEQSAVVKDGELAIATVMNCTLSVDHRSVDGAVGAQFLAAFKGYMQDPMSMML